MRRPLLNYQFLNLLFKSICLSKMKVFCFKIQILSFIAFIWKWNKFILTSTQHFSNVLCETLSHSYYTVNKSSFPFPLISSFPYFNILSNVLRQPTDTAWKKHYDANRPSREKKPLWALCLIEALPTGEFQRWNEEGTSTCMSRKNLCKLSLCINGEEGVSLTD